MRRPDGPTADRGVSDRRYRRPVAKLSARERANLPDRAFAYIDREGRRRLPINDAAHVRNALARFGRVAFEDDAARDRARQRLLNAAKRFGIMPVGFIDRQLRGSSAVSLPTGNVTFLLTDIEGSTALLQQLGPDYAALLRDVRAATRHAIEAAGGHRVDSHGDEFFAVFERADAAVLAAIEMQTSMREGSWPGEAVVNVRAGIHGGRPALTETGYVGLSVHTVARICAVAHGGQIVVSSQTVEGMATPAGVTFRSLGEHRLAGLPHAHALLQVHARGLRTRFPPLRL
jgi:class 3 adenylate cyclase